MECAPVAHFLRRVGAPASGPRTVYAPWCGARGLPVANGKRSDAQSRRCPRRFRKRPDRDRDGCQVATDITRLRCGACRSDRAPRRRPRFRDGARPRAGGSPRAFGQETPDVDRAGQPPHGHSARGGAAQPAHVVEARLRRRRRCASLLPAPPRAVVQPRISVDVAHRDTRAADTRPNGGVAARGLFARHAGRRRDRLSRPIGVVAHHVADPERGTAPPGVLHVDRARHARAPAAGRARPVPVGERDSTRSQRLRRPRRRRSFRCSRPCATPALPSPAS